ncbi:MAG: hypothetical protein LBK29_00030 [Oscillospiraceae bacterium]|jgi:hypothetical protein|nr:hypothetical protein [Oscillospiraceae bacterium]
MIFVRKFKIPTSVFVVSVLLTQQMVFARFDYADTSSQENQKTQKTQENRKNLKRIKWKKVCFFAALGLAASVIVAKYIRYVRSEIELEDEKRRQKEEESARIEEATRKREETTRRQEEIEKAKHKIEGLERTTSVLGNEEKDAALEEARKRLEELKAQEEEKEKIRRQKKEIRRQKEDQAIADFNAGRPHNGPFKDNVFKYVKILRSTEEGIDDTLRLCVMDLLEILERISYGSKNKSFRKEEIQELRKCETETLQKIRRNYGSVLLSLPPVRKAFKFYFRYSDKDLKKRKYFKEFKESEKGKSFCLDDFFLAPIADREYLEYCKNYMCLAVPAGVKLFIIKYMCNGYYVFFPKGTKFQIFAKGTESKIIGQDLEDLSS